MPYPRYTPPDCDAVDFDLPVWRTPACDRVDFDLGAEQGAAAEVRRLSPGGTAVGWRGTMRRCDGSLVLPWRAARPVRPPDPRILWRSDAPLRAPTTRVPWAETRRLDLPGTRLPWQPDRPCSGAPTRIPWAGHMRRDAPTTRVPWGVLRRRDHEAILLRLFPLVRIDQFAAIPWGTLHPRDNEFRVPWRASKPRKDILFRVYWGRTLYERICRRDYEPPDCDHVDFNLTQLLAQTGDGDHTDFFFDPLVYDLRCTQREPGGWRDNHFYQPGPGYPHAPRLEALVVINTAWITRLPDNAPVQAFSVNLSADMDSWCWSFTARIPAASLPMVMTPLDPTELQVNINGHVWNVLAESWRESHRFAESEYTIQGRSRSAVLAAPYAPEISGGNEAARTARQLAEEQLEYTGWTLDWRICDWTVPPGALSYSNAAPVQVIRQIAEAAGGRVQTHRTATQLIVLPRLPAAPWQWSAQTPALGISDFVVRSLSREYQPAVACNGVYISGENQGVLCLVKRAGTDGATLAPMVTDALITAEEPARARGILELGRTGHWSKEGLDMPLTRSGDLPGLLEIGALVTMQEGNLIWRGQVVGLKIGASFDADRGLNVSQHVDIERYRGT